MKKSSSNLTLCILGFFLGDTAVCGTKLQEVSDRISDKKEQNGCDDVKGICVSPSVKYAGCDVYAKKRRYGGQRLFGVTIKLWDSLQCLQHSK